MEFVKFKRAVHAQFNQLAAGADMLFLTNVDKDALWDCYLNSFPEEERQSHNCNNCKHYGRVVAINDLDLHVVEPNNLEIYYSNRIGRSGGKLDVDENAGYGKTRKPVENIIWVNERKMLEGKYVVYVNNFHCRESVDTGFTLEIEHNGEVRQFVYDKPVKHKENVMVAEITYSKSKGIQIRELIPSTSHSSVSLWNIDTNKFHKVNVMMLSPNYWDEQGIGNKHYFFMLDDCKNPEPVRGFFNEYLNSELTPHRKVFEVLADKMKIPYQEHQLSGLGFSSTMRNSVIVKVDGTFSRTLKVNF